MSALELGLIGAAGIVAGHLAYRLWRRTHPLPTAPSRRGVWHERVDTPPTDGGDMWAVSLVSWDGTPDCGSDDGGGDSGGGDCGGGGE